MSVIARLPTIIGAYLAACVAAGFATALLTIVLVLRQGRGFIYIGLGSAVQMAVAISMLAGIFALVPTAVLIAFAEVRRRRSAAFYGFAGTVAAILALGTMIMLAWSSTTATRRPALLDTARRVLSREMIYLLIARVEGAVGGLVYWRIAGRTAGSWRVEQEGTR